MDPNKTLAEMREALAKMDETADWQTDDWLTWAGLAAGHAENLDEWLSKGGFLPDAWKAAPTTVLTVRVPENLVAQLDALPGNRSEKIRDAISRLVDQAGGL